MRPSKNILVTPLDWGLGHATRCIPIIKELTRQGADVAFASNGRSLQLLKKEFPALPFFTLPSYGVTYSSDNMVLNMVKDFPKLINAVLREQHQIKKIITEQCFSGVISDNRFGCFSKKVPCVFLTHQIDLIVPSTLLQWLARQANYFFINQYDECWVPDVKNEPSLSGTLSHSTSFNHLHYLGALSRMVRKKVEKKQDVIVVLSGPEPQRTKLEEIIIQQAQRSPYHFLIIQGKTEKSTHFYLQKNIEVIGSLTSEELNDAILASDLFIGRPGYSSIMDLAKLRTPALLIPTPGQTEQIYLGERLAANGFFEIQSQSNVNLSTGIPAALEKGGLEGLFFKEEKIEEAVNDFLLKCGQI